MRFIAHDATIAQGLAATSDAQHPALRDAVRDAVRDLTVAMPGRPYSDIPPAILALARSNAGFTALLFATLIAHLAARAASLGVPTSILPELATQAARILAACPENLDSDAARKDVAICLGLALPCAAQLVEETGTIMRRAVLPTVFAGNLALARQLVRTRFRAGPYLEIHTHTPMLPAFNAAGWTRCYHLIADILRAKPHVLGMVGGSWFYDPQLAAISPRLAYLADLPLAHGALRVHVGAKAADLELATATSPSRRALVEQGTYAPQRWQLIWPRDALLAWSDQHRDGRQNSAVS